MGNKNTISRHKRRARDAKLCGHPGWKNHGKPWLLTVGGSIKVQVRECTECGVRKHVRFQGEVVET